MVSLYPLSSTDISLLPPSLYQLFTTNLSLPSVFYHSLSLYRLSTDLSLPAVFYQYLPTGCLLPLSLSTGYLRPVSLHSLSPTTLSLPTSTTYLSLSTGCLLLVSVYALSFSSFSLSADPTTLSLRAVYY